MKWIALMVAVAAILPLSQWLRGRSTQTYWVWVFVGVAPFVINTLHLDMSLIDWAGWPGYVKGLQVSMLDIVAVAILLSLPPTRERVPFKLVMGLYFLAALLSIAQAQVAMSAAFYVWQLARMFLIYVVVARASVDSRVISSILTGLAVGLCYQAGLAGWQRFGLGILQTGGSFGHQNSLGLISHFALFPLFALLLVGQGGWKSVVGCLAGLVVAVLTTSRATLGLAAAGMMLLFVASTMRGWTARKSAVLLCGVVAVALLLPVAISSFDKRFAAEPISEEYDERAAFERAAAMMLSDHPMGVGANNYTVIANTKGYLDRAGVAWLDGSRSTLVHNAYWVAAAETGYLGFVAFSLLLIRVGSTALLCSWRTGNDTRGDLILGLGVGVLIVSIHNAYEWIFFYSFTQYLFSITAGIIAGLAGQLGYWGGAKRVVASQPRYRSSRSVVPVRKIGLTHRL